MRKLSITYDIFANTFSDNDHLRMQKIFICMWYLCKYIFICKYTNFYLHLIFMLIQLFIMVICKCANYHLHVIYVLINLLRMVILKCTNYLFTCDICANTFPYTGNKFPKCTNYLFSCDLCANTFPIIF